MVGRLRQPACLGRVCTIHVYVHVNESAIQIQIQGMPCEHARTAGLQYSMVLPPHAAWTGSCCFGAGRTRAHSITVEYSTMEYTFTAILESVDSVFGTLAMHCTSDALCLSTWSRLRINTDNGSRARGRLLEKVYIRVWVVLASL